MAQELKRVLAALSGLVATTSVGWAAEVPTDKNAPPANWSATLADEARYFSWGSDRGTPSNDAPTEGRGHGWQLYVPFALQVAAQPTDDFQISVLGRGGRVWATQTTAGQTGEVETMTDTQVSGTFTFLGINGVQPFVSLNFNLPTGRPSLRGTAAFARMDPDLVEIASFGEGLNIGPTVGVTVPITRALAITLSAGHTRRGEFERESSIDELDPTAQSSTVVDPGSVWTFNGGVGYQGDQLAGNVSLAVSQESDTEIDGDPLYRPGRRYSVTGGASYAWPGIGGTTTLNGAWAHGERNEVLLLGASSLITEPMNTNSDVWRVGIEHLVPLGPVWLGPVGSFLSREDNGYNAATLQFVPQKQRWAGGLLARVVATDSFTINLRGEHIRTREHDRLEDPNGQQFSVLANAFIPGSAAVPEVSSNGWQAALGFNFEF